MEGMRKQLNATTESHNVMQTELLTHMAKEREAHAKLVTEMRGRINALESELREETRKSAAAEATVEGHKAREKLLNEMRGFVQTNFDKVQTNYQALATSLLPRQHNSQPSQGSQAP